MRTLRSAAIWAGIAGGAVFCFLTGLITALALMPFRFRLRPVSSLFPRMWAKIAVAVNPAWPCPVAQRRLPPDRHFVIVSNHESLGDIIISLHLRHLFKFISKASVFSVPCVGWYMYLAGYIKL